MSARSPAVLAGFERLATSELVNAEDVAWIVERLAKILSLKPERVKEIGVVTSLRSAANLKLLKDDDVLQWMAETPAYLAKVRKSDAGPAQLRSGRELGLGPLEFDDALQLGAMGSKAPPGSMNELFMRSRLQLVSHRAKAAQTLTRVCCNFGSQSS